jgi:probable phosphoglycerate mutase
MLDTRVPGPTLTVEGARQAEKLVHLLSERAIDASEFDSLYVSDMVRTQLTARSLAVEFGITPLIRRGIREISAGELGMRNDDSARKAYLDLVPHWVSGDLEHSVPGGEKGHEFFARFDAVVDHALAEAPRDQGRTVGFVSHGAAIRCWAAARSSNISAAFAAENLLNNLDTVTLELNDDSQWIVTSWANAAVPCLAE